MPTGTPSTNRSPPRPLPKPPRRCGPRWTNYLEFLVQLVLQGLTDAERAAVLGGNAQRVYSL